MAAATNHPAAGVGLSAEAWEAVFRAQVAVMRRLAQDDIWHEVSMREYDVLFQIARSETGHLRLRDLNERILLSQPSLSRLVDRLEARGLLVRERAADDARGVTVRLTDAGAHLQRQVGRRHVRTIHRQVGGALTDQELHTLRDLCTRLLAAQPQAPDSAAAETDVAQLEASDSGVAGSGTAQPAAPDLSTAESSVAQRDIAESPSRPRRAVTTISQEQS